MCKHFHFLEAICFILIPGVNPVIPARVVLDPDAELRIRVSGQNRFFRREGSGFIHNHLKSLVNEFLYRLTKISVE